MGTTATWQQLDLAAAARTEIDEVLAALGTTETGLTDAEVERRRALVGPNVLRSHGVSGWHVLGNQLRNPLLPLLVLASIVSGATGQITDAGIILVMVVLSIGLGFANEFRSEKAVEALHDQIHHTTTVLREDRPTTHDVTELVPGDIVLLTVGDVVPADVRLLTVDRFEADEAILTGESMPATKQVAPATDPSSPVDLVSCAFMGTVVRSGIARAVVVTRA